MENNAFVLPYVARALRVGASQFQMRKWENPTCFNI